MQSFEGDWRRRRAINLGGASASSSSHEGMGAQDVLKRAREERERRELERKKEISALRIQAFYRGRHEAIRVHNDFRQRFDLLRSNLPTPPPVPQLIELTRMLVLFFEDVEDARRLGEWCALVGTSGKGPQSSLFAPFHQEREDEAETWSVLTRQVGVRLARHIGRFPKSKHAPLFLLILARMTQASNYPQPTTFLERQISYLVRHGLESYLRSWILSNASARNSSTKTVLSLSVAPLQLSPGLDDSLVTQLSDLYLLALDNILVDIFTIPNFLERIPSDARLNFAQSVPLHHVIRRLSSDQTILNRIGDEHGAGTITAFLSTLIGLLSIRTNNFKQTDLVKREQALISYLSMLTAVMGRLAHPTSGPSGSVDPQGDSVMRDRLPPSGPANEADAKGLPDTSPVMEAVASEEHLSFVMTASRRHSSSSRPALAAFLVSILFNWSDKKERVIETILYRCGGAGAGFVREMWRMVLRTSKLTRTVGAGDREKTSAVLGALKDSSLASDWSCLVLLAELYLTALQTIGDDEFYATSPDGKGAKNPLSLDDVVGLSGLVRDLAFALYWQEGQIDLEKERVQGVNVPLIDLRTLATNLLVQLHDRDSRRPFTPSGHWHMTSQFDLSSFKEAVLFEDEQPEVSGEDAGVAVWRPHVTSRQRLHWGPRLSVLNKIPFVIPFESRCEIFRQLVRKDEERMLRDTRVKRFTEIPVRRDHIFQDGYNKLNGLGSELKRRLQIVFIDQYGMPEAGIDGGGVFKEFLTSLSKEAFNVENALWKPTKNNELYPSSSTYARETPTEYYAFLGRVMGRALYQGVLIDVTFAAFFLNKWLGRASSFNDLAVADPELYQGLLFLKNYEGDVEKDLNLDFTMSVEDIDTIRTVELVPGGSKIPVTRGNRLEYIRLVSNYRLNVEIDRQSKAFLRGLSDLIDFKWLRMFNAAELGILVSGTGDAIDVEDLRNNSIYPNLDDPMSAPDAIRTANMFWEVAAELDSDQRRALVKFVTSCARPPLLGFSQLNPKFAIQVTEADADRLPTSSTCVNLLKIPKYANKVTLRQKLLTAIFAGAGFDLS